MIPVGTLCLLLPDHSLAGMTCTIAGPLANYDAKHRATGTRRVGNAYRIEIPGESGVWVAFPRHVVPLRPPGSSQNQTSPKVVLSEALLEDA